MAKKKSFSKEFEQDSRKALLMAAEHALSGEPAEGALILAAREGNVELARVLLDQGASVGSKSKKERRPVLSVAAIAGEPAVVRLLLDRGADVSERDGSQATAIYHATLLGHTLVVKELWEAGVECSRPGNAGALSIYARQGGHEELAKWLDALWERRDLDGDIPIARESCDARRPRL